MSKLLRLIVNIFLICAILVAVAILVPPLLGVNTTIVDTPSMNTNLPLGSITYSQKVDVSALEAGDEVLKDSGSATYAYVLRSADAASGTFTAVSATDPDGQEEEIILRNQVPKVVVEIPLIGYVVMAMQSLEGRLIIGLVVALVIILFALSELWKPIPDDEIDEDEEEEEVYTGEAQAASENGIDTDVIRAAVEENQSEVAREDASREEAAEAAAALAAAAGEVAAYEEGEDVLFRTDEPLFTEEDAEEAAETFAAEEEQKEASSEEAEQLEIEHALYGDDPETADEEEGFDDTLLGRSDSEETDEDFIERLSAELEAAGEDVPSAVPESAADDELISEEIEEHSEIMTEETAEDAAAHLPERAEAEEAVSEAAETAEDSAGGETETSMSDSFEEEFSDVTAEEYVRSDGRFVPFRRPEKEELLENAKAKGIEPKTVIHEPTGITFVDYSDLI